MDTKLSMVRFTAWAIPAVGFVGTVRGIGAALQEAQGAMGGDISGVTMGLGVTFNATLTALCSCIVVMFWMHQLQQYQDRLVLDARTYVDRQLLRKLRVVGRNRTCLAARSQILARIETERCSRSHRSGFHPLIKLARKILRPMCLTSIFNHN